MKTLLLIVVTLFAINNATANELVVGVKSVEPFAYKNVHGQWQGLSIDLLEAIAETEGFTYKITELNSTPELIDATANNNVDMSLAAISLTHNREKVVDFSHTYFNTSLGILSASKTSPWEYVVWIIGKVLIVLAGLIAAMYVMGFLISRVDIGGEIEGIHEGAWWSIVTFTTTGYGDEVPVTPSGKVVASGWMIASMFLGSIFTAYMSSAMTVQRLSNSTTKLTDLYAIEVDVVEGTTAEYKLAELGIEYNTVSTLKEAVENFKSGKTDVVVYDKAMLDYVSKDIDDTDVWRIANSDESYAIALPPKSNLIEKINLGISNTTSTPKWKASKAKYFGAE